jgi:flagellar hook-basal body complex protein FliE
MVDRVHAANVESMLSQIRKYQAQISPDSLPSIRPNAESPVEGTGFGQAVKDAISAVNQTQHASRARAEAYERGEEIPLAEVVLGMQKASLAFEATLQIRNKVLKAYEDILNMPV